MCSRKGIFRVSRRELDDLAEGRARRISCTRYGTSDGMRSPECAEAQAWSAEGRVWFATKRGAVSVDPARLVAPAPPPVVIQRARWWTTRPSMFTRP